MLLSDLGNPSEYTHAERVSFYLACSFGHTGKAVARMAILSLIILCMLTETGQNTVPQSASVNSRAKLFKSTQSTDRPINESPRVQ